MRLSSRFSDFLRTAAPLIALVFVALVLMFAPRIKKDTESVRTPNMDAYNTERAQRLAQHRLAAVYVYKDIPKEMRDKGIYTEPTAADAFRDARGFGSGIIIDPSGLVLTAEHVVTAMCPPPKVAGEYAYCSVVDIDHTHVYRARVVKVDKKIDTAALRIEADPGKTFNFVPAAPAELATRLEGREVQFVGRPFGHANTAVFGIVSNAPDKDELCAPHDMRVMVALAPGNSGGAAVDIGTGTVVSIVSTVRTFQSEERTGQGNTKRQDVIFLNALCSVHTTHLLDFLRGVPQ